MALESESIGNHRERASKYTPHTNTAAETHSKWGLRNVCTEHTHTWPPFVQVRYGAFVHAPHRGNAGRFYTILYIFNSISISIHCTPHGDGHTERRASWNKKALIYSVHTNSPQLSKARQKCPKHPCAQMTMEITQTGLCDYRGTYWTDEIATLPIFAMAVNDAPSVDISQLIPERSPFQRFTQEYHRKYRHM